MDETKQCRQCGRVHPIEKYRLLRGERKTDKRGRQSICKDCDSINALFRRLSIKDTLTPAEQSRLDRLESIYKAIHATMPHGLLPSRVREKLNLPASTINSGRCSSAMDALETLYVSKEVVE